MQNKENFILNVGGGSSLADQRVTAKGLSPLCNNSCVSPGAISTDADLPGETDWVSSQERMFPQFLNAVLRRSNAIPFNKSTARNAVKDLFHSDAIQVVLEKVMQEIARGTLAPRTDTILHSDVGVVEGVCSMLGSYEKEF
eukprot:51292_1